MKIIVNVGLMTSSRCNPQGEQTIPVQVALNVLHMFSMVSSSSVHISDTEQTLVAEVSVSSPLAFCREVSAILCQDCIAWYNPQDKCGDIVGQYASLWGKFNPEYFILPTGKRLG